MHVNDLIEPLMIRLFLEQTLSSRSNYKLSKGVKNINNIYKVFRKMCDFKIPLLIHGEVNQKEIDVFDREKIFIEKINSNC